MKNEREISNHCHDKLNKCLMGVEKELNKETQK
jgi:hypothetical protein